MPINLKRTGIKFDATHRNDTNDNWTFIETAISEVEGVVLGSDKLAREALNVATTADGKAVSTQTQLDTVILESGTSDAETIQARGVEDLLYKRLDKTDQQLAEKAEQTDLEIERARISGLIANAGNTDGNAELLDIRVGFDGITYPTAGDATRALGSYMTEENQSWGVI